MRPKRESGFTLLELMIVVCIIGILAAVATPKYVGLVDQAKDAATKANLHNLRVAVHLYYASSEGVWPATLNNVPHPGGEFPAFLPTYMERIPEARLRSNLEPPVPDSANVVLSSEDPIETPIAPQGGWIYNPRTGNIKVNCDAFDTKGKLRYIDY